LHDSLVNQDTYGGTNQVLLALAASPGAGFAAVWRDQRDGMIGLYMGRMNGDGALLEPERPIHQPNSSRRLDPGIALGKDNSGAVVWVSHAGPMNVPWVRTFDSSGKWLCGDRPLVPLDEAVNGPRGRDAGARQPAIVALAHGGYAVAWTQGGQVKYQEIGHDGTPLAKTAHLAPSSSPAEAGVHLAVNSRGSALCVWRTKEGNMAMSHGRTDTAPVNCGMGVLCRLITDPVGGFWGAFLVDGQAVLRHLSVEGRPDRTEIRPVTAAATGLDITLGDDYLALLIETSSVPRGESRGAARGAESARKSDDDRSSGADHPANPGRATGDERSKGDDRAPSNDPSSSGDRSAGNDRSSKDQSSGDDHPASDENKPSREPAPDSDAKSSSEPKSSGNAKPDDARSTGGNDDASHRAGTGGNDDAAQRTGSSADQRDAQGRVASVRKGGDGSAASFTVYVLDRDGRPRETTSPIRFATADAVSAQGPRIVSNGKRLFAAWTDSRNGDEDVYGRTYEPTAPHQSLAATVDERMSAERRVNTDVASSDQNNPRLASSGRSAVIVWQDDRDRVHRVFARAIGASGFDGDEFSVPVPVGNAPRESMRPQVQPTVAMRSGGEFAVQWSEARAHGGVIRRQIFREDKKPLGAPVELAEEQGISSQAIAALAADGGYLSAWIRGKRAGMYVQRMSADGTLAPPAQLSDSKDGELGDVGLALLDDQRSIVVWQVHGAGDSWSLRARFVDSGGSPQGDELTFEPSQRKIDWQPCVAPAAINGFVMGWCSGAPSDPGHDVVARVFDSRGKPAGPILPISVLANEQDYAQITRLPDKTYVIAWEDDISNFDHTYLRRIMPNAHQLGPVVRMNELETKAVEDRTGPQIAALGDGIVGAWNDRRRSLGWDVYLRILGPRFDDVKKR
jgi:hypothetical protein